MGRKYVHLSLEERSVIQAQLMVGLRPAAIAAGLRRHRSTVLRELRRNGWKERPRGHPVRRREAGGYYPVLADRRARRLRRTPRFARKLVPDSALFHSVVGLLREGLSPEQIAFTLAHMPAPVRLSHETIYTALYAMPRGHLRSRVLTLLRRSHTRRGQRSGRVRRPFAEGMTLIDQRPAEVDERLVPGHWEGDLIKGRLNQSRVGVLVERSTLFVVLVKLEDGRAETAANGFARILHRFDEARRRSMTYDQGREMASHTLLARQAGIRVYFAHPHSPWERGICENTNGLLRQYLPKGKDLGLFSQQNLDDIAMLLNARPRKTLAWKAPAELFLPKGEFDFVKYWSTKICNVALEP